MVNRERLPRGGLPAVTSSFLPRARGKPRTTRAREVLPAIPARTPLEWTSFLLYIILYMIMSTEPRQVTVRVTEDTRALLRWLSEIEGRSMQAVLRSALEVYRRQLFLDEINAGYAELRRDRGSWQEWTTERMLWDRTLLDGLVAEPKRSYGKARHKKKGRR